MLLPVSNMASSRSEENVNLKYFQHKWCHSVSESCNFMDSYKYSTKEHLPNTNNGNTISHLGNNICQQKATTTTMVHHLAQLKPKIWQYQKSLNKLAITSANTYKQTGYNTSLMVITSPYTTQQSNMAITPAKQNFSCKNQRQPGNNICQKQNKNIRVHKITGLTNTVTPFVLEMLEVNIFLRPQRSHVRNW